MTHRALNPDQFGEFAPHLGSTREILGGYQHPDPKGDDLLSANKSRQISLGEVMRSAKYFGYGNPN